MKLDAKGIIQTIIAGLILAYLIGSFVFYRDVVTHMSKVDTTLAQVAEILSSLRMTAQGR